MTEKLQIRGRQLGPQQLDQIRALLSANPQWSRWRLSIELARLWNWRTPTGQLKDVAARDLLNRLEERGLIVLPPRQQRSRGKSDQSVQTCLQGQLPLFVSSPEPVQGLKLSELLPLRWHLARGRDPMRRHIGQYLDQYHYLGSPDPLGQLHYLVQDRHGRDLACVLFGPAAWKVAARDAYIGWSAGQREAGLGHLANNSRFLILPWVRIPHLASHLLAGAVRRLRTDWQAHHGQQLWLVESCVEKERFAGTCYRAANWIWVGQTKGRTRNDRDHRLKAPVKDVYLLGLVPDFRQRLCGL